MTRKDYKFFAGFVKQYTSDVENCHNRYGMYLTLCDYFTADNHLFDRDVFYRECEVAEAFERYSKWLGIRRLQGEKV